MNRIDSISGILSRHNITLTGEIVVNPHNVDQLLVFIEVIRDTDNKQSPTNMLLKRISNELFEQNIDVDFILVDKVNSDVEAGARASLMHSFGELIRNAFVSMAGKSASVWIDIKRDITSEESYLIKSKMKIYFENLGIDFLDVFLTRKENTPPKLTCLRALRTISPSTVSSLSKKLMDNGFIIPSETWLSHKLDALRKSNLVLRLKNGTYAVTYDGLSLLGTKRNARSPDITRLLDLARRGR